jgi:uncharacterized membrane protein HdeD (DUF308 family)
MSTDLDSPFAAGLRHELAALRGNWLWFVVLGIALMVLGVVALGSTVIASLAVEMTFGVLLLIAGVGEIVGSFWARRWSGVFLHLLSGILSAVVGVLFLARPGAGLAALTLLVASLFLVGGAFKIVAALSHRFAHWGWPLVSGLLDVVLGVLILAEYPTSALWVLGLFLGINMLFRGAHWIALGLAIRSSVPATASGHAGA